MCITYSLKLGLFIAKNDSMDKSIYLTFDTQGVDFYWGNGALLSLTLYITVQ